MTSSVFVLLSVVVGHVCGYLGQYYGFGGDIHAAGHVDPFKTTRVRTCSSGSSSKCYYCDCHTESCGISKDDRQINRYYKGLFNTVEQLQKECNDSAPVGRIKSYEHLFSFNPQSFSICCDTVYQAIAPIYVTYNGIVRRVVTPITNGNFTTYQTVWQGTCRIIGSTCCNNGSCINEDGYPTYILVHAIGNDLQFEFIPIVYSRNCKCVSGPPPLK